MKKIITVLTICFIGLNGFAIRNITVLKNNKWYVSKDNPVSAVDFKNKISTFHSLENLSSSQLNEENVVINTIIDVTDEQAGRLMISIEQGNNYFEVWVEGQKLENLQKNEHFLSEIDKQAESGEILLTLVTKTGQEFDIEKLQPVLQNITITSLSGIVISWLMPQKDQYFDCPMLEIHVLNTLEKDIDGKLIARILKPDTNELVSENNNCAFSRNKMETVIGVIFPDIKSTLVTGKFIAEVTLVDKENNEEVVDQLLTQIQLE